MQLHYFQLSRAKQWALLEMARPERLNALDQAMLLELEDVLAGLEEEGIKAVVLTGQGPAFAAGADVAGLAAMDHQAAEAFSQLGHRVFQKIEEHPAVFIAAINGYALGGGCELALACDLRLASTKSSFGQPEINLGIIPGFGGTQRLPKILGRARAKEWILTGRRYTAEEALQAGLVSSLHEPEDLLAEAQALANELAKKSGPILALAKEAIGSARESQLFAKCFLTEDSREGLKAFLEKRSPGFQDR